MDDTENSTDWRMLREFEAVDLEKSFVLSWEFESGALLVDTDLFLMPGHPFYEEPRPAEKVCIRSAVVEFQYCHKIQINNNTDDISFRDAVATLGPGAIHGLRRMVDGRYEISGEFPLVLLDAERPILRLKRVVV